MERTSLSSGFVLAFVLAFVPMATSSTWYVNGVSGNDSNSCKTVSSPCKTISHAISLTASGDSIIVAAATYKENLSIGSSLTVTGAGAKTTIIDGGGVNSVVTIATGGAQVKLSSFTIRNGSAEWGGGIFNNGMVTINNSSISGNISHGRGFRGAEGGGVVNFGTLTITNSTLSGNSASGPAGGAGGGIFNAGVTVIANSTIAGNSTAGGGGGIYSGGTMTISSSTLSNNNAGFGGGIDAPVGSVTLQNSILSNNSGGNWGNCEGLITSDGYNLSSDASCKLYGAGDLNSTNPKLGSLQYNGGPTQTMAILSGSPAIDAGNPSGCTDGSGHLLKTDQRGMPRPDKEDATGCDMGAYESQTD